MFLLFVRQLKINVRELVFPYVERLGETRLDDIQKDILQMMESTLKDIAHILNLSGKTIEFYRKRIRQKVGITNKQINLRTFLNTPR